MHYRRLPGLALGETQALANIWSLIVSFIRDRYFGRGFGISVDVSGLSRAKNIRARGTGASSEPVQPKIFPASRRENFRLHWLGARSRSSRSDIFCSTKP